jgi:hypothetical protein
MNIFFIHWFRVIRPLSVFSGVFIAEEVDGVGDTGSGDTPAADAQTLLEAFLDMSLISDNFTDEHFFQVKSETPIHGTSLLKCRIVRISELSDVGLKEFCCICNVENLVLGL